MIVVQPKLSPTKMSWGWNSVKIKLNRHLKIKIYQNNKEIRQWKHANQPLLEFQSGFMGNTKLLRFDRTTFNIKYEWNFFLKHNVCYPKNKYH